ncbi:hypothetical protein LTR95_002525, partial [Oleoguttula sp. CCFEE 5521]
LHNTPFDLDIPDLACLDQFDSFWEEGEQVDSVRPSRAESNSGGGEEQQALEEVGTRLQSVGLLQLQDYDVEAGPPPEGIRYTIEWKAVLKTKRIGMGTEQDVFLTPAAFWETTLRKKVEDLLDREYSSQDRLEPNDTVVVVSVSKRAERDLTKEFVGFDIGWSVVEEKLESWGCHFYAGHCLTVKITFRFRPHHTTYRNQAGARGRQSATRPMRHDQGLQQDAEQHATGEAAYWRTVYSLLRCPGRPCQDNNGYCWRDPHGGKHHRLLTIHLKQLVTHMAEGKKFESHQDVPNAIRQHLYAEANQRIERHQTTRRSPSTIPYTQARTSTPAPTPGAMQCSPGQVPLSVVAAAPSTLERLKIPGSYEDAIHDYVKWQQDQAKTEDWIAQIAKAGDILLKGCYKLDLFYRKQLINLLTAEGVLDGIALTFHEDIPNWLPDYRRRFEEIHMFDNETPGSNI